MAFARLFSTICKLAPVLPYLLLHSAIGILVAALLGWAEVIIRTDLIHPKSANEFVGMYWVVGVFVIGPIACVLALPLHTLWYFRMESKARQHACSVGSSIALYALLWALGSLALPSAAAQTAKPQTDESSHLVVQPATQEEFRAVEQAEADTRRINERLNFRLHSLTGITFRMWFCGLEYVRDKPILARMLDSASLPEGGREMFVRWYELKLRMSENSVYVWRKMGRRKS